MNNNLIINDIPLSSVLSRKYDYGFFFSGYEERCLHLSTLLKTGTIKEKIIIQQPIKSDSDTTENFDELSETIGKYKLLRFKDFKSLNFALALTKTLKSLSNKASILIDYTSMPRQVYCDIINVVRTIKKPEQEISLTFFYAHGRHESSYKPAIIGDIYCLRGCEASISSFDRTIAVVGLGFDDGAPLRILESVEPNEVFCLYAYPAAIDGYEKVAIDKNQSIITFSATSERKIIPSPLSSISDTYSTLYELVSPYLSNTNITLLPFGPKPHVLASILLSMSHKRVSCMYADSLRSTPSSVPATGEVTCALITLK